MSSGVSMLVDEPAPTIDLSRAFSFDIKPPWVLGIWPNVTTGLLYNEMNGYRVPLVTGTAENDVTGSLTYYFSPTQELRRITLEGDTGDARKLIAIMRNQHGFVRHVTPDSTQYIYHRPDNGKTTSQLKIWPERVVSSTDPHRRFKVSMVLTRPAT